MSWSTKKLGDICEIITGGTPKTSVMDFYGNEFLWAGPSDLDNEIFVKDTNKKLSKKGFRESGIRVIPKDSVMMSCIGYIGKLGIAGEEMATNQQINTFVPNQEILDFKYLYYSLILKREEFKTGSSQTTVPIINKAKCSNIEIPLPPLSEQKKIVAKLDAELEKIKEAKRLREEALADTDRLLPSTLHEIFEAGKAKVWKEKELEEVCKINPAKDLKDLGKGDEVTFVPMRAVDEYDQEIKSPEIRKIKEVEKGYTYFAEDDILFAKITPCMENGKVAVARDLINGIGFGTTEFHVLRANKDLILSEFIYHIVRSKNFREEAEKVMAGAAGQRRVPKNFLEKYKILLPSLAEQKQIVSKLDKLSEQVKALRELQKAQFADLESLEKAVLREAFEQK